MKQRGVLIAMGLGLTSGLSAVAGSMEVPADADLYPDQDRGVLEVRIHTMANPRSNRAVQHLLDVLNAAEYTYPGTNQRLTYSLSSPPPGPAEVPP